MCDIIKEFGDILTNIDIFAQINVSNEMKNQIYIAGKDYDIKSYMTCFYAKKKGNSIKVYYKSESFIGKFYFKDGLLYRNNGPVADFKIKRWSNFIIWYQHQIEIKNENRIITKSSEYKIENIYLNNTFDPNHNKDHEIIKYINKDGLEHRLYGPAVININNNIVNSEWHINGKEYDIYDYKIIMRCYQFIKKVKKNVIKKVLYNSNLICKDIANMISNYVY